MDARATKTVTTRRSAKAANTRAINAEEEGLVQEIARRTGESFSTIRRLGFHLLPDLGVVELPTDASAAARQLAIAAQQAYERGDYSGARQSLDDLYRRGFADGDDLFRLAYCHHVENRHDVAARLYAECIEASKDADTHGAHFNLGLCYVSLGQLARARDAFRSAVERKLDSAESWWHLADCYRRLGDAASELDALENAWRHDPSDPADLARLAALRLSHGDPHTAIEAYKLLHKDYPSDSQYTYGLALASKAGFRYCDAFHYARCITQGDHATAARSLACEIQEILASYSPRTSSLGARDWEIEPGDYVNPYTLLNVEIPTPLPPPLELFAKPTYFQQHLGDLRKRSTLLRAESRLNNGRVSWLPGMIVTEQVVYRSLAVLDDSGWSAYDWAIFCQPLLNRFLMHGDLSHFLCTREPPYPLSVQHLDSDATTSTSGFAAYVSRIFANQWRKSSAQAISAGHYSDASVLLAVTLPLSAADLDTALEPIRRCFMQRCEELRDHVSREEYPAATDAAKRAAAEARLLNAVASQAIMPVREGLCEAYLALSSSLWDGGSSFDSVAAILRAAGNFHVTTRTRERLNDLRQHVTTSDSKLKHQAALKRTVNDQVAQDTGLSVKDRTVAIPIRSNGTTKTFAITADVVSLAGVSIRANDLVGLAFSLRRRRGTPIPRILIRSKSGVVIAPKGLIPAQYDQAVTSLSNLHASRIVRRYVVAATSGEVSLGPVLLSRDGIRAKGNQSTGPVPWHSLHVATEDTRVILRHRDTSTEVATISTEAVWNGCLLPTIVQAMSVKLRRP